MPSEPGTLLVRTSKKIDVDPAEWAKLTLPEPPRSAPYLDLLSRMEIDGDLRFFTAERDGQLIAAAFGAFMRYPVWKNIKIRCSSPVHRRTWAAVSCSATSPWWPRPCRCFPPR